VQKREGGRGRLYHDTSSSSSPPKRTALRSGSGSDSGSARMATRAGAAPRSLPRKRDSSPERAELLVGVDGATLDATVDALALSGVRLELVADNFVRGFFRAERAGGGGRGIYEREGDRGGVEE